MEGTLAWPLEHAARYHADRTAVLDGTQRLTYGELGDRVRRLGAGFERFGIAEGDYVAVLMGNTLEHLELWLAVPAYGRVLNTMNTRLAVPELAEILDDCGARVLVVDGPRRDVGRQLRERCATLETLVVTGDAPVEGSVPYTDLAAEEGDDPPDLAASTVGAIAYTGGTTGRPKGVMLSHGNVLANSKHLWHLDAFQREDVYLHAGPIFHLASSQMIHALTWVGATHVMLPTFEPTGFARLVEDYGVTVSVLVPTMIQMLVDHLEQQPRDVSSLRLLHYGASPMSPVLLKRAMRLLGCDFLQGYGMTEAAPGVSFLPPQDHHLALEGIHPERLDSVGLAVPGVQFEIRDPDGFAVDEGVVGEVWVRGPNVMQGYLNRPQETAAVLIDGWYRTGDAGYTDDGGYLFLVDRLKDMIVSGGENIYSMEVERALAAHPAVQEVAVIGVPDDRWGERVHAIVHLSPGSNVSEMDLITHCRSRIAGYKCPKSVDLRNDPLPKSGTGKIVKRGLRASHGSM